MKTVPQKYLAAIVIVASIIAILAVSGVYSTKVPPQRQMIYVFVEQNQNPNGPVAISEIKPNSMVRFYYPDPNRFENRDPFEQFLLIRLPDYLGGSADDASAFRAYSAIDPSSHCLVKYWPEEGRRRIEDPCGGNMYEPVSGHAVIIGGNPVLVSKNLALPYLGLSLQDGFLYAEPPVWTEDQNGAIGIGRKMSETEIQSANQFISDRENKLKSIMNGFSVPQQFSSGYVLDGVFPITMQKSIAQYIRPNSEISNLQLSYEYCNCTKSMEQLSDEMKRSSSQILQINGIPVVAYPNSINAVNHTNAKYTFVFYNKGFKITLATQDNLDSGMSQVMELLEFWK